VKLELKMSFQVKEKNAIQISLVLLLLIGIWLILDTDSPSLKKRPLHQGGSKLDPKVHVRDYNDRVNHHLSFTDRKILRQAESAVMENEITGSTSGEYDHLYPKIVPNHEGVDFSTDPRGEDLAEKLGRGRVDFGNPKSAKEIIHSELFDEDQQRHYTEAYKEAYAKAYVAQALREGYVVKLSKDYKVLSIVPARGPSNEKSHEIFDTSPGSAQ